MSRKTMYLVGFFGLAIVAGIVGVVFSAHTATACFASGTAPTSTGWFASIVPFLASLGLTAGGVLTFFQKFADNLPGPTARIVVGLIDVTRLSTYKQQFDQSTSAAEKASIRASVDIAVADLVEKLFPTGAAKTT